MPPIFPPDFRSGRRAYQWSREAEWRQRRAASGRWFRWRLILALAVLAALWLASTR